MAIKPFNDIKILANNAIRSSISNVLYSGFDCVEEQYHKWCFLNRGTILQSAFSSHKGELSVLRLKYDKKY